MHAYPRIYVGLKGTVIAIERNSGAILWQKSLAGSSFVNVVDDGDHVFALSHGEAYCLDAGTGAIIWHNPLKGFGLGIGSLAVPGRPLQPAATAAQIAADQQAANAARATSGAGT